MCLGLELIGAVVVVVGVGVGVGVEIVAAVPLVRPLVLVPVVVVPVLAVVHAPHHQTATYPPLTHKQIHEMGDTTTTETASTEAARAAGMQMLVDKMACRA